MRQLVVFARYPEQGRCKTRLIPAVGEEAATRLHRLMTEHTLNWARALAERSQAQLKVYFSGGSPAAMRSLFGDGDYVPQCVGDLGDKLRSAISDCTQSGASQVLIVGTDCPELTVELGMEAWRALEDHACCFVPAADGGYTLVGLRADARYAVLHSALLRDISWGTERVLEQSVERLDSLPDRPAVSLLRTLRDVDHPEDLPVWQAVVSGRTEPVPEVSIIIPTLHTEPTLSPLLSQIRSRYALRVEPIVVAAGDDRATLRACRENQTQCVISPPGRGRQLNAGAQRARADVLWFLHADCQVPATCLDEMHAALSDARVVGGAFQLRIGSSRPAARLVELGVAVRTKWFRMPYGDQGIFVRTTAWQQVGGFPEQAIMEDYEFIRRLRRHGSVVSCPSPVTTSARRWDQLGYAKTTLVNQLMVLGYHLGCSPEKLASFYRKRKRQRQQQQQ